MKTKRSLIRAYPRSGGIAYLYYTTYGTWSADIALAQRYAASEALQVVRQLRRAAPSLAIDAVTP